MLVVESSSDEDLDFNSSASDDVLAVAAVAPPHGAGAGSAQVTPTQN